MSAQERGELPRWPKLTQTVEAPKEWGFCQRCGQPGTMPGEPGEPRMVPWREHDDDDRPTAAAVVLCGPCSDLVIEDHPRLYGRVQEHEPMPGVMQLCKGCVHREGYLCGSPDLKLNGGEGLAITYPEPAMATVRRAGGGRCRETIYVDAPTECAGREETS